MLPDRVIRERARKSEKLAALTPEAERLWWRLVTMADDHGRLRDNPVLILAEALPLLSDRITVEQVEMWLGEMAINKMIKRYQARGQAVLWLIGWDQHQKIAYPEPSELPGPDLADVPPGKPGRTFAHPRHVEAGDPRAPAHARNISLTTRSSNSRVTTPGSTGQQTLFSLDTTPGIPESTGGGSGGNQTAEMSRRRDIAEPEVPEALKDFDATLREIGERYRPTTRFFALVSKQYLGIDGLDLVFQAEGMVRFLIDTPKGRSRTDIVRFADNWLSRAAENALRRRRGSGTGYNATGGTRNGLGQPYGMGSPLSQEARDSAAEMERRSRALGD